MKVIVNKQFNKSGDEYLCSGTEEFEVSEYKDTIYLENHGTLYEFPKWLFYGLLKEANKS